MAAQAIGFLVFMISISLGFGYDVIMDVCPDPFNQTCREFACLCMPDRPEPMKHNHTEFCTNLSACINSTGVRDIYTKYITEEKRGKDKCSGNATGKRFRSSGFPKHGGSCSHAMRGGGEGRRHGNSSPLGIFGPPGRVSFPEYLAINNSAKATEFQCCMGEKMGKFLADGTANTTFWNGFVQTIKNDTARIEAQEVLSGCLSAATGCNSFNVTTCILQGCVDELFSHSS